MGVNEREMGENEREWARMNECDIMTETWAIMGDNVREIGQKWEIMGYNGR